MKLTELPEFYDQLEKTLNIYIDWDKNIAGSRTPRGIVGAGDDSGEYCIVVFKGNEDDLFALKMFLDKRKMVTQ